MRAMVSRAVVRTPDLGVAGRARVNAGTLRELVVVLGTNGRWWLLPMVIVLMLAALLLMAVQVVEYVAPFVYTVF